LREFFDFTVSINLFLTLVFRALVGESIFAFNLEACGASGHTMKQHKFQVGEHVSLQGGHHDMADGAGYEVIRLLPDTSPEPQYRIKRSIEIHERVAGEHLLRRMGTGR
jgi:hypothetical protein